MASCSLLRQNIFFRSSLRLLYPKTPLHTRSPFSKMTISTTQFANPATSTLFDLVKSRRTYYALKPRAPFPTLSSRPSLRMLSSMFQVHSTPKLRGLCFCSRRSTKAMELCHQDYGGTRCCWKIDKGDV